MATRQLSTKQFVNLANDPASGTPGQIYYNTTLNAFKYYNGVAWTTISSDAGVYVGEIAPSSPTEGDLWFNSSTIKLLIYYDLYWIEVGSNGGSGNSLPIGGTAGQILSKIDATDYNVEWIDNYTSNVKHEVKAGESLTKGQAVYVSSANGTNMIVSKASNSSELTSSKTMGLIDSTLGLNDFGFVITEGLLSGLNTSSATAGDPVWLGTNGNLIYGLINKPVAPAHLVYIGVVTRVNNINGEIFVHVQNGFELQELHNVLISSLADKNILSYDSATSLWKNQALVDAIKEIDGTESGIDADLLDGQHGSYYLDTSSSTQTKSGNLTISGTATTNILDLNESQLTADLKNITVTTPFLIDSFVAANYRSAEYILQFSQGTNYSMTKVMLIHNGTDVAISEYGHVEIGNNIPYDFSTAFTMGNLEVSLTCSTANSQAIDLKFTRVLFDS